MKKIYLLILIVLDNRNNRLISHNNDPIKTKKIKSKKKKFDFSFLNKILYLYQKQYNLLINNKKWEEKIKKNKWIIIISSVGLIICIGFYKKIMNLFRNKNDNTEKIVNNNGDKTIDNTSTNFKNQRKENFEINTDNDDNYTQRCMMKQHEEIRFIYNSQVVSKANEILKSLNVPELSQEDIKEFYPNGNKTTKKPTDSLCESDFLYFKITKHFSSILFEDLLDHIYTYDNTNKLKFLLELSKKSIWNEGYEYFKQNFNTYDNQLSFFNIDINRLNFYLRQIYQILLENHFQNIELVKEKDIKDFYKKVKISFIYISEYFCKNQIKIQYPKTTFNKNNFQTKNEKEIEENIIKKYDGLISDRKSFDHYELFAKISDKKFFSDKSPQSLFYMYCTKIIEIIEILKALKKD